MCFHYQYRGFDELSLGLTHQFELSEYFWTAVATDHLKYKAQVLVQVRLKLYIYAAVAVMVLIDTPVTIQHMLMVC